MEDTCEFRFARRCYYICLAISVVLGITYLILYVLGIPVTKVYPYDCSLYSTVGLYCAGCGGTRAVEYFMQGKLIQSFLYHPAVPYSALLAGCYMISHTLNIVTRGRIKAMLFRPVYFYVLIAVILVQWFVKDALIIISGTYLLD